MLIKEEVLSYLTKGYIHVSKKDYLFFHNLQKFIEQGKNITTRQNELFDKLLSKYQRQFKKQNLDGTYLKKLNWKTKVVPTDPLLLIPTISLIENFIVIKAPYNKKFASSFSYKRLVFNNFKWDKINKKYFAEFNTVNLKLAYSKVKECFKEFKLCPNLQDIVNELNDYSTKVWQPTLMKNCDHLYVSAINEYLYDALTDVNFEFNLASIYEITKFGVKVDSKILNNEILTKFLNNHEVILNFIEVETIIANLKSFGINKVYIQSNSNSFLKNSSHKILELLDQYEIKFELLKVNYEPKVYVPNSLSIRLSKSIMTHSNILSDKVIVVANDMPIDIK